MLTKALQDIDQIFVGVDPVQSAGAEEALDHAHVFGPDLGPAEEPVLPIIEMFR